MRDISIAFLSARQIVRERRVHRPDVFEETIGRLRDVAIDRARHTDERAVRPAAKRGALDEVDARRDFSGDRAPLRLVPVEKALLIEGLLDGIAVPGHPPAVAAHADGYLGRLERLPARAGQAVLRRMDLRALALGVPV